MECYATDSSSNYLLGVISMRTALLVIAIALTCIGCNARDNVASGPNAITTVHVEVYTDHYAIDSLRFEGRLTAQQLAHRLADRGTLSIVLSGDPSVVSAIGPELAHLIDASNIHRIGWISPAEHP